MFGVDTTEFIIVAIAALLFIGPKELPAAMRAVGSWVGKIRGMARHFSDGVDAMMRESELEEMEKKWREENDRIMREYPALEAEMTTSELPPAKAAADDQPALPLEPPPEIPPEKRELP